MSSNKKTIKIFYIIESLGSGGAERLLTYTLKNINKNNFSVIVVCLIKPLNFKEELENSGIDVVCLNAKNLHTFFHIILRLYRLIIKKRPDIVHTHLYFANIYGRIAAKLAGVKSIIATLHNPDYTYENNGGWKYKIRKIIDKYTGKVCNSCFIAVSNFVKKDFEKQLGFRNIKILHNCVDSSIFNKSKGSARNEFGINRDDFVILNIGRLHSQKGQLCLIEAFNLVYKSNNRCRLIIIGKGLFENILKNKTEELNLEREIIFLENRKDIPEIMKISDMFVFPSNYEGFGIALVEAMASGLPVVASKIDVLKEIIDDGMNGILVEKGNHIKLAETISSLINNVDFRHYLGRNAKEKAVKLFNPIEYTQRLESIYRELVYKNN